MWAKKPKFLSLKEKADIIDQYKSGLSVTSLARKYNVAKSTICSINKKREKIVKCVSNTFSGPGKRKTLRASENPKDVLRRLREKAVLKVLETRAQQKNITDYFS